MAVSAGYAGTRDDYTDLLANIGYIHTVLDVINGE
jgi:hypothetical protein